MKSSWGIATGFLFGWSSLILWGLFATVMWLKDLRDTGRMWWWAPPFAYIVLGIGYAYDVFHNAIPCWVQFKERPREWTVSDRLRRLVFTDDWRAPDALWYATHMIEPFAPGHIPLKKSPA
jgi:hypothetical protein